MTAANANANQYWNQMFSAWQKNMPGAANAEAYKDMFEKAGKPFFDMMHYFQNKSGPDAAAQWAKSFDPFNFAASMPGLGYTREKQEDLAELYRLWSAFDVQNQKYNAAMATVGLEAVQKFQEYIISPPAGDPPLTSIKEVYAKWVDICEGIYARYAMTQEYTELYGDVVNALMRYRKKMLELSDDFLEQMNMPTRREMDSLHQRVHELKREVAAMKKAKPARAAAAPEQKAAPVKKPVSKKPSKKKK
jgi:hypothetical protein